MIITPLFLSYRSSGSDMEPYKYGGMGYCDIISTNFQLSTSQRLDSQNFKEIVLQKTLNFLDTNETLNKCKVHLTDYRGFSFKFNKLIYESNSSFAMKDWLSKGSIQKGSIPVDRRKHDPEPKSSDSDIEILKVERPVRYKNSENKHKRKKDKKKVEVPKTEMQRWLNRKPVDRRKNIESVSLVSSDDDVFPIC